MFHMNFRAKKVSLLLKYYLNSNIYSVCSDNFSNMYLNIVEIGVDFWREYPFFKSKLSLILTLQTRKNVSGYKIQRHMGRI